jgi:hypothetical protein
MTDFARGYYVLERKPTGRHESARTDAVMADGYRLGDAPECPTCGGAVGMRAWLPPFRVWLETWGTAFGDFAFEGAEWFLISERAKHLYERSGLTGLSSFEKVDVVKVKRFNRSVKGDPPVYYKADVARSAIGVDVAACGYEWTGEPVLCPTCLLPTNRVTIERWKRVAIPAGVSSPEDIFIPRGTGDFVTTARFKEFCESNKILNAVFVPAEEYGHDFYPWESDSPAQNAEESET